MLNQYHTKFPVAFVVFNRPECTRKVFSRITEAQPARLFIIADGPRKNVIGEDEKCREVRSIVEDIDCDLSVNFAESDHGLLGENQSIA